MTLLQFNANPEVALTIGVAFIAVALLLLFLSICGLVWDRAYHRASAERRRVEMLTEAVLIVEAQRLPSRTAEDVQ